VQHGLYSDKGGVQRLKGLKIKTNHEHRQYFFLVRFFFFYLIYIRFYSGPMRFSWYIAKYLVEALQSALYSFMITIIFNNIHDYKGCLIAYFLLLK
jgi:hypothetical protein